MDYDDAVRFLNRYVYYGIPPGGFLGAVLANDLYLAFHYASSESWKNIGEIITYVHGKVPLAAQGSASAVQEWISRGGIEGDKERMNSNQQQEE